MEITRLKNTIDILSKLVNISEDKKEKLIIRYSSMNDKDVIKELSQSVYRTLGTNEDFYNYALTIIRNINPNICPPVEEMKTILSRMFSNEVDGNMSLEDNHRLVTESLVYFTKLFNEYGIDYYIVGALPCFLKTGQSLFRYHDDIDIMVNEEDLPKIAEIIELSGYKFQDDRFPTPKRYIEMQQAKPLHTILAQNPNNEFHLGFFCFRREPDNSITMKEYSHRLENENVIVDVLEKQSEPIGTSLAYDEHPTTFLDTTFKTSSIESVYNLKSYTQRLKDITDIQKLEPYIDKRKLIQLSEHPNRNITIQNVLQEEMTQQRSI